VIAKLLLRQRTQLRRPSFGEYTEIAVAVDMGAGDVVEKRSARPQAEYVTRLVRSEPRIVLLVVIEIVEST
jgi:hypothetical protein